MNNDTTRIKNLLVAALNVMDIDTSGQGYVLYNNKELVNDIKEFGFEFLGSGYFAAVFSHPDTPDVAYKIGFKKEDSGAAYAAYCRTNQGKAGIPVIYDITRHSDFYCVVMKRYESLYPEDKESGLGPMSAEEASKDGQYDWARHILYGLAQLNPPEATVSTEFKNTVKGIRKFFIGIASFDLHEENVMWDKEAQQLIITDPVSFSHSADAKWSPEDAREEEGKIGLHISQGDTPRIRLDDVNIKAFRRLTEVVKLRREAKAEAKERNFDQFMNVNVKMASVKEGVRLSECKLMINGRTCVPCKVASKISAKLDRVIGKVMGGMPHMPWEISSNVSMKIDRAKVQKCAQKDTDGLRRAFEEDMNNKMLNLVRGKSRVDPDKCNQAMGRHARKIRDNLIPKHIRVHRKEAASNPTDVRLAMNTLERRERIRKLLHKEVDKIEEISARQMLEVIAQGALNPRGITMAELRMQYHAKGALGRAGKIFLGNTTTIKSEEPRVKHKPNPPKKPSFLLQKDAKFRKK